ncbi:hypothetical protein GCM10027034_45000 [Ramlibacter solisilvae]|uniref:Haem-binding uptake Tiki superfamily ChaN domain-containing protein n=1 Tax=Ramlibacter tataouinensis TaxID=94132 RepID=A0A127JSY0_9BURK|nr:ChaN family lipoprotein [Ramlibacter tataouinensis]AMO23064.1 hypothetical protein UC35_09390 [Ramlibacter tataouinensis]
MARLFLLLWLAVLAACAPYRLPSPLPDVILLGEQHDDPQHQQWHQRVVQELAGRGQLAALALEMAERGLSTAGLPAGASEAEVKAALGWDERGWPWAAYGPAVMTAVRAGVPVLGANLPRARLRDAMADTQLDGAVTAAVFQAQQQAVRAGHCDLLPASQWLPMARVQIARDRSMAQVLGSAIRPGQAVVLLAGAGHVDSALGVPQHLGGGLRADARTWPAGPPQRDYCEGLRQQLGGERPQS